MIPTLTALIALLLFVLPGFVLVQLQEAQRARRPSSGDLETVLRALFYAVVIQALLALTGWTGQIYDDVRQAGAWTHHATAIALYVLVSAVAIPTIAGLLLSWLIKRSERSGELKWWALALGARDARHGWDRAFEQQLKTGALVNGHRVLPTGGHRFSPVAAMFSPHWWPPVLPGGVGVSRGLDGAKAVGRSGIESPRRALAVQGLHPLSRGRLGQPVALRAVCDEHVGVVE